MELTAPDARIPGPELRLVDRRAFVGFPPLVIRPGVIVSDFALQIPDVTFPLNLSGGASKYQNKRLDFGVLEVSIDAEVVVRHVRTVAAQLSMVDEPKLLFRPGHLEVQARFRTAERSPFTFKVAFDGDGERLSVYIYDVRSYAYSPTPISRIGAIVSQAILDLGLLPEVELRGATGFSTRILPALVEPASVGRGFKMPALDQARLADAVVSPKGLRLRFTAGGLPPPTLPDAELLLTLEGARAFADAESYLAAGQLDLAKEAYLRLGDVTEAHPFAVERLLTLLVADVQTHELVLDLAASLGRRHESSATALWAEGIAREKRGEFARAAERFLALCSLARRNNEEAGAFCAAEAAARVSKDHAPQMAVKALHEVLGIKPDHVPSLKALARASDQANDRSGAIRAYRRLAALSRDVNDAADAHVQLARLCAVTEDDIAGARLHCEAALRLVPDHPEALHQLGELCFRSGEWLRAIKALDRLRSVALARHEVDRIGRSNLLAGLVWEQGLKQPENALLRFREAAAMLPGEVEPLYCAARVAESLGKVQEAVAGYQQAVELAGPSPRTEADRKAAHASHHALARLLKTRLGDPLRARDHLEAALIIDPSDRIAMDELLPYFRASDRSADLAAACEKAAAIAEDPVRRAALWAEAGEVYRGRLNQVDRAEKLLTQAIDLDGHNRIALTGLLSLAEGRRDGAKLCRCLKALADLTEDRQERCRYYRRLAVAARDLTFDLDLAATALRNVLHAEPDDLLALGELAAIDRRRNDVSGLAWALENRARVAEAQGDRRLAAGALRELAQIYDLRLGRSAEALAVLERSVDLFHDEATQNDLATLALRVDRPSLARRALESILARSTGTESAEKTAELRARLGRACELLGDTAAAIDHYAAAFPLRRLDDDLAARLEALYRHAQKHRELGALWAVRAQVLVHAGRPEDAAALHVKAAGMLRQSGDGPGAMAQLSAALEVSPRGAIAADALTALATLAVDRGEPKVAAETLSRRAQLETEKIQSAKWYWNAAELVRGSEDELSYVNLALSCDADLTAARLRRAALLETSKPELALEDFESLLKLQASIMDADGHVVAKNDLAKRAARAAVLSHQIETAKRWLAVAADLAPGDIDVQTDLAQLYRQTKDQSHLVGVLEKLWPRLTGDARVAARRECALLSLQLGRHIEAIDALRSILIDGQDEQFAASHLVDLLPQSDDTADERVALLSRLVRFESGTKKVALLARRAATYRQQLKFAQAQADYIEAAAGSDAPGDLLRALIDTAMAAHDSDAELAAWRSLVARCEIDDETRTKAEDRLISLASNQSGDHRRAIEIYELLLGVANDPQVRHRAWFALAQAASALGEDDRSLGAWREASAFGPAKGRVAALLEVAAHQERRGDIDATIESLSAALAIDPRDRPATEKLITCLRAQGDWEGLAEVLAAWALQTPKDAAVSLYRELASIYLDRLSQLGPGEAALRRVVQSCPDDVEASRTLALLVAQRGEVSQACEILESSARRQTPTDAAIVFGIAAQLAQGEGDVALELRFRRKAHVIVPQTGAALLRLAELLYLHGATAELSGMIDQSSHAVSWSDDPERAEQIFLQCSETALRLGQRSTAEALLVKLRHERPLCAAAVLRQSELIGENDPRASIQLRANFFATLAQTPRLAGVWLLLAREAKEKLGDRDMAKAYYAKALAADEASASISREYISLLRELHPSAELSERLADLAQRQLIAGDIDDALSLWDEEARLAEQAGRIDDALRTLEGMSDVCEDAERHAEASRIFVRRAHLLADSKFDLNAALQLLEKSWHLSAEIETVWRAIDIARRRGDRDAEIDWLELAIKAEPRVEVQANLLVQLAKLHLGLTVAAAPHEVGGAMLVAPDQSEAALHRALELSPRNREGEAFLLGLYERLDRVGEIGDYFSALAEKATSADERADLLLYAATVFKERAGRSHDAAAALLAARTSKPDDATLTAQVADLLGELGRRQEAAEFDAMLLEANPLHRVFDRHAAFLRESDDLLALATLYSRRAEHEPAIAGASTWLKAAEAFRGAGAVERAELCESQAFEKSPENTDTFELLFARAEHDPRRQASLLADRSQAVPSEQAQLLKRRAEILTAAKESLLAAMAWDDYLAVNADDPSALQIRSDLAMQSAGPRASQPFDRRIVQLGGVEPQIRDRSWLRLGQAALESRAWRDAVDAFEAVLNGTTDDGDRRSAMAGLGEAYERLNDPQGIFKTTLRLAERSIGAEREAMYRRALTLAPEPSLKVQPFEWLSERHPADVDLYEIGCGLYRSLERYGDLLALHQKFASVAGGSIASNALLEAAEILQKTGDFKQAVQTLADCARLEEDPKVRSALHVRRGEIFLRNLGDRKLAQLSFERALLDDGDQLVAVRELVELLRGQSPDRFSYLVERLKALAGEEAIAPYLDELTEAYEATSRLEEAIDILRELPTNSERLLRQIRLAEKLDLKGEALVLRAQVATGPVEREEILNGFIDAELVPFAVRLGNELLEENALSTATRRKLAERLAPTAQGSLLSLRLWPDLLRQQLGDADGWTLFAEALRREMFETLAHLADGIGSVLTSSRAPAPMVALKPIRRGATSERSLPADVVEISAEAMPHLHRAVQQALTAFEASNVRGHINPYGSIEASVSSTDLILGAGALAALRETELDYFIALVLTLGDKAQALLHSSDDETLKRAVTAALDACPSSIAAGRVIALIDPRTRDIAPYEIEFGKILRTSALFEVLALHVVETIAARINQIEKTNLPD